MTGADLLARMQVIHNELDIASGGDDESRCLTALDMAQDYFEMVAAASPRVGQTTTTVSTAANTETTAWPSSLKRVDALWYIDASTSRPAWELTPIDAPGGHAPSSPFPFNLTLSPGTGAPREYAYDNAYFYWLPLPDATYTVRVYGLIARIAITARGTTFGWDDEVSIPLAAFACRLLKLGVDDPTSEYEALAQEAFTPTIRALRKKVRQAPSSRYYTHDHTT